MGYMTDERRMIQEQARIFAMKEVLPLANRLDPEKGDIPRELGSWPTWAISASSSPSNAAGWGWVSSNIA